MMSRRQVVTALVAVGMLAGSRARAREAFRGGTFSPPSMAPDFVLQSTQGGELRLSTLRGKAVALGFGYSYCPDICPTTLAYLAQARARLREPGRLQVLYITVDPERDTLARLKAYVDAFDKTFAGLTGTESALASIRKAYGVSIQRESTRGTSAAAYLIHHTASVYLIDPAGRLRVTLPFGMTSNDMAHDISLLLEG